MIKMFRIFMRDVKVNTRDFMALYIMLFPILFSVAILIFTPGVSDTSVNLAVLSSDKDMVAYFEDFAKVETFDTVEAIEQRVLGRDEIIGVISDGDTSYLLQQGNEKEQTLSYSKLLFGLYQQGATISESNATIHEFGESVPPLKKLLVNIGILLTSILGGMLIAMNIVEEKVDNTVSAINVTPVSRIAFIFGKGLIGVASPILGSLAILLITGFGYVNIGQILLIVFATSLISLMLGFIEGIINDDFMSAAGTMKMLFLPLGGAIAAIELLGDFWQKFFYWIPFYWTYKGNAAVLDGSATWPQILMYTGIVLLISIVIFALLAPRIRKGLEQ